MGCVKTWLSSQVADFFDSRHIKKYSSDENASNSGSDYVKKQLKYVRASFLYKINFPHYLLCWQLTGSYLPKRPPNYKQTPDDGPCDRNTWGLDAGLTFLCRNKLLLPNPKNRKLV
jgi:hypothetical protein